MSYVLKRTDGRGGYVALPGSPGAYTHDLRKARRYLTQEAANNDRCPENEVVVPTETELQPC